MGTSQVSTVHEEGKEVGFGVLTLPSVQHREKKGVYAAGSPKGDPGKSH
jgi:hypothetical protein